MLIKWEDKPLLKILICNKHLKHPQDPNAMDPAMMAEQQAMMKMGGDIYQHIPRQMRDNYNPIMKNHTSPETYLDFDHFKTGGKMCNGAKIKSNGR